MIRYRRSGTAIAASALLGALMSPASAAETTIKMKDPVFFTPVFKVVAVGDTAVWVNEGQQSHTVTTFEGTPQAFDSSENFQGPTCDDDNPSPLESDEDDCVEVGDSFSFTFTKPGTYDYYCKPHVIQDGNDDPAGRPNPDVSAQQQPCGMCGRIIVKAASSPTKAARPKKPSSSSAGGSGGDTTGGSSPAKSSSPSPSASPSRSPSPGATVDASGNPVAQQKPDTGDGGSGSLFLALLAILALSGAGYATWRRFLATQ